MPSNNSILVLNAPKLVLGSKDEFIHISHSEMRGMGTMHSATQVRRLISRRGQAVAF